VRYEDGVGTGPGERLIEASCLGCGHEAAVRSQPGSNGLGSGDLLRILGLDLGSSPVRTAVLLVACSGREKCRGRHTQRERTGFHPVLLVVVATKWPGADWVPRR